MALLGKTSKEHLLDPGPQSSPASHSCRLRLVYVQRVSISSFAADSNSCQVPRYMKVIQQHIKFITGLGGDKIAPRAKST